MKKRYTLLIILLLALSCSYSQNNTFKLGFTGCYPIYGGYWLTQNTNWSRYNELHMNMWQGWSIGADRDNVTATVLDSLANHNLDGYMEPDTVIWAAMGRQQVNYASANRDNDFKYNYINSCAHEITDNSQWGSGQLVLYFDKNGLCNQQNPGGIALGQVNENGFQSFSGRDDPMYQAPFPYNDYVNHPGEPYIINQPNKYYIKPRIRVDVNDVMDAPNKEVVRVIVKKYDGNIDFADTVTIYTDYFKNSQGQYDGTYIEDFIFYIPTKLSINASTLNTGRGADYHEYDPNNCHVDYQVYWYGTVSFWIDYVKVQDEAAYRLLNNNPAINYVTRNAITSKVNNILANDNGGRMKGFYTEELDYSSLACMDFLNNTFLPAITQNNPNYKAIGLINPWSFERHLKNKNNSRYAEYLDVAKPPVFMLACQD